MSVSTQHPDFESEQEFLLHASECLKSMRKDEVATVDPERAHVYGRVWSVLGELQEGGPYGL